MLIYNVLFEERSEKNCQDIARKAVLKCLVIFHCPFLFMSKVPKADGKLCGEGLLAGVAVG